MAVNCSDGTDGEARSGMRPFVVALGLCFVLLWLLPGSLTGQQGAASEAPLTNEDILELHTLGLGSEVIIAKINQARQVDFRLGAEDLGALKREGLSDEVLAAMLERATDRPPSSGAVQSPIGVPQASQRSDTPVVLITEEGETPLSHARGDRTMTYAFVTMLTFIDYPGLSASVRTRDTRPSVRIYAEEDPTGRFYLVTLDVDKDDGVRSLKIGRGGVFGRKSISTPDADWVVSSDVVRESNGVWKVTPVSTLKPGEYGLWARPGYSFGSYGIVFGELGGIFAFGVD